MAAVLALLVLGGIVIGAIAVARKVIDKRGESADQGGDVLTYLLLALAVGVAVFALASLAATAFPAEDFVIDVSGRVANALAGLVVATPVALFLWRRQEKRVSTHPESSGWTVYLALIEAVFMTSLVAALIGLFEWLLTDTEGVGWTNIVVFGGVIVFHEWAVRRTPPASDGASLPRVVGSAIGLVATVIGLGGIIGWLLSEIYASLAPTAGGSELGTWVSFLLAGAPVWYYRWLRPWPDEPDTPRNAWMSLVAVAGLSSAVGSLTFILIQSLEFLVATTERAGTFFDFLPATLSVVVVGGAAWAHHRRQLGTTRNNPVRAYEYTMSGIGLVTTVSSATGLTAAALGPPDIANGRTEIAIAIATTLVVGAAVWLSFWMRIVRLPQESEAGTMPRRIYLIGLAVVLGLTSAGALIATLVIFFQRLLGSTGDDSLVLPVSLFIFAGLATWHLLRINGEDRELLGAEDTLSPYTVTIICSQPGMIAARFPSAAKVRVLYRDDDSGVIDEQMATEIIEAVQHRSAYVWVDENGFRVAPVR